MPERKIRTQVPRSIAAEIQFQSDRTCCVCREAGKPIQIHHLNNDPNDHDPADLAVLCLDCHDLTQIQGGFGRKLTPDQIVLYRDDWHRRIAQERASATPSAGAAGTPGQVERATSVAEAYRENEEFTMLAAHYHSVGNHDLRDKYIERALAESPDDADHFFLRGLQKRGDLIPPDIIDRELSKRAELEDWSQRARALVTLGRFAEAASDYMKDIQTSLEQGNFFAAAYYLKEMSQSGVWEHLFKVALDEAAGRDDLWWQVRALEELGYTEEVRRLLLEHASRIEQEGGLLLREQLAWAREDAEALTKLQTQVAKETHSLPGGAIVIADEDAAEDSADAG